MSNKLKFWILGLTFLLTVVAIPVFANDFGLDATAQKIGGYDTTKSGSQSLYATIDKVISVFLSMIGIAFLAIMLYAGLRWMTARGKDELVEKSKTALEAGIIGFIIVVISYGLSKFIFSKLIGP